LTEREQIIEQLLELHFPNDTIAVHAIDLLDSAGYAVASVYLDVVAERQRREIEAGRTPSLRIGHHKLSRVAL